MTDPREHTGNKEDLDRLLMGHSPKLQSILEAARKRFLAGAGIPHEIFWKRVDEQKAAKSKKRAGIRKNGRTSG